MDNHYGKEDIPYFFDRFEEWLGLLALKKQGEAEANVCHGSRADRRLTTGMACVPVDDFWASASMIASGEVVHIEARFTPPFYGHGDLLSLHCRGPIEAAPLFTRLYDKASWAPEVLKQVR